MSEHFLLHQEPFQLDDDDSNNIFKNTSYLLSISDDISMIEPQPSNLLKNQLLMNTDLVESPKNYLWTRQEQIPFLSLSNI